MAVARIVRAMDAQTIAVPIAYPGNETVEDVARAFGQRDALELVDARPVKAAELDCRRVRGNDRDVGAVLRERHAERLGASGSGMHASGCAGGCPVGDEIAIERRIAFRRSRPADIRRHRTKLHAAPRLAILPER